MPATVVQSGDYTLELDTGFDVGSFRLDDPVKGVLDNTTYPLGPTTQFADITEFVTSVNYMRGRKKEDDQFGAGTMSFSMLDQTGILGPYDSTSPYYDPANNQPGLAPMRQVRLKRNNTYLFTGIVVGYNYTFELAGPNRVDVECADEFYKLAQTFMDEYNVSSETSGQRITSVLALPEVDYIGSTDIDTGTVNLGHDSPYTVPQGTNTLTYLQQINDAEQGRLFVAADGEIVFQPRIGNTLSAPVINFNDIGTGAKYDDLTVEFDADYVINRAYIEALDGKNATATDAGSIAKYFTQTRSITNSLLHEQDEIDDLAAYFIKPEPQPRYTDISTSFSRLTSLQRDTVATIEIGDTISIEKTIPGLNSQIATELSIEGIQGEIDVATGHRVTFYTSPTTIVYELILDDAQYGVLDSNNVLAAVSPPVIIEPEMITIGFDTVSPSDLSIQYFGTVPDNPTTTANQRRIYFTEAGTITAADLMTIATGVVGTAESWQFYIRHNDTTDHLIATVSAATALRRFSNAALSIAVAANDFIECRLTSPTWGTNPTNVLGGGYFKFVPA